MIQRDWLQFYYVMYGVTITTLACAADRSINLLKQSLVTKTSFFNNFYWYY